MYKILDRRLHDKEYGKEKYLSNWPMLYILENGKQAYIGQSTNVADRMQQHRANAGKAKLGDAHFIYSKEFNQSVTFDYESKLIQLMSADEQYALANGNGGIADKNYYDKGRYDKKFEKLWRRLQKKKIVKHTIGEIVNSDLFKYSPYKELNDSQREAVGEIFESIMTNQQQPIVVNGMPGSGKTIVAIFLFKMLVDYEDKNGEQPYRNKKMALVIPQTSLRKTIKKIFKQTYGLRAKDVIGPSCLVKEKYDIVLVDEAHRLNQRKAIMGYGAHDANNKKLNLPKEATELDWVLKQVKSPVLFFDAEQVIGPSSISEKVLRYKIDEVYKGRIIRYHTLTTQMRVRGGNNYIEYVRSLLDDSIKHKLTFSEYDFKIVKSFKKFEELLVEKENKYKLSRMIAGYAWPWISKKNKSLKDIKIEGIERMWNNKTENWVNCATAIEEVGCIHSIQGYDLNYAFVILGNDIKYNSRDKKIEIDSTNYHDKKRKEKASEEELLEYIENIYYVLMTRGIRGTYLYIVDVELRKHLSKYIDVIH